MNCSSGNGYTRWAFRILVAMVGTLVSLSANATEVDVAAGSSVTSRHRSTPVLAVDVAGSSWRWDNVRVAPDIGLTRIEGINGYGQDFSRASWVMAGGLRLPRLWKHLYFSFQLAAATPQTPAISSTQQFVSTLGWSQRCIVVMLRHISNGSTRAPNLGETMLLLGMRFGSRR